MEGPAYFVSHGGEAFPSLEIVLQGYGVKIDLVAINVHQQSRHHQQHLPHRPRPARHELRTHAPRGQVLRAGGQREPVCAHEVGDDKKTVKEKVHGKTKKITKKTTKQVAEPLAMPTAFVAQRRRNPRDHAGHRQRMHQDTPGQEADQGKEERQGTTVKPTEHHAKFIAIPKVGFFATLRGLFHATGSGASRIRWRGRMALCGALPLAFLAIAALSACSPAVASAAIGPLCEQSLKLQGNGVLFAGLIPADLKKRTLTSVVLHGGVGFADCETEWRLEYSKSPDGPWSSIPGGSGIIPESEPIVPFETGKLTGLEPETLYYERGVLTDVKGVKEEYSYEHTGEGFETRRLGPTAYPADPVSSGIAETSARVRGGFEPGPFATGWRVEYAASRVGPWAVAADGSISQAEAEADQGVVGTTAVHPEVDVTGLSPESTYYTRLVAEDEPEWPAGSGKKRHKVSVSGIESFETFGAPVAETFATHGLHGESVRALGSVVADGFDTHYYFQYRPTAAYGSVTATLDAGSGGVARMVAAATCPLWLVRICLVCRPGGFIIIVLLRVVRRRGVVRCMGRIVRSRRRCPRWCLRRRRVRMNVFVLVRRRVCLIVVRMSRSRRSIRKARWNRSLMARWG